MSSNFVKNRFFLMKFGQNVHFNDRNVLKLPFLNFFQNFPIFPDFPRKLQFWINFSLKFLIGKPYQHPLMRRPNFSAPIPPGHPGDVTFLLLPQVLITLIFTCPALYNHQNHPFSSAPPFFITRIFSLTPGLPRGGWGQNNLTGA